MIAIQQNVRVASIDDLPILLKWGKDMFKTEKQYIPFLKYTEGEARERYMKQISDSKSLFLIAELYDKPVGYLYAHIDKIEYLSTNKPQCEIEVIFLDEDARGSGLSQKLINSATVWAKNKDAFEIKAGIFAQNVASRRSFEKSCFKLVHTTYSKEL